jgi:hypothetical protein
MRYCGEEYTFRAATGNGHRHADDSNRTSLARLIVENLNSANRPLTAGELKEAGLAAKFDFGGNKPGRVIHWGLVGTARGGTIERNGGKWQFVKGEQH